MRSSQRSVCDRRHGGVRARLAGEHGQSLLETALTLPLLLLVSVSIFEFGRAYQTWQVLTNAAREGARVAVLPNPVAGAVEGRVIQYLKDGQLGDADKATVDVDRAATISIGGTNATASIVTVNYPFQFMVLQPVASLVVRGSTLGGQPFTMSVSAEMRNETQ